ncbi:MAG: BON domain-containing protein [Planctomycetaceae bacterium]|nr:BON domain-containing protein [Planctomycetaceae bacterium]
MFRIFGGAIALCLIFATSDCFAQRTSGGTTGGVSSGNSGSVLQAQSTAGSSGTTGASAIGGGTGSIGGGRTGQSGQTTQFGQQQSQFNLGDGSLGQQVGQSGFIGQNNAGFVGNRMAGQAGVGQSLTPNFAGLQNNATANRQNTSRSNLRAPYIRPQLRMDFSVPEIPVPAIQAVAVDRLASVPRANGVNLAMDAEGTVTLSGIVATENDRRVLEAFVRMEPGVRDVNNEIVVQP